MQNTYYTQLFVYLLITSFAPILAIGQADVVTYPKDSIYIRYADQKKVNIAAAAKAQIIHFVMKNEDNTFGYDIFIDAEMTYHQPNIPAVSGYRGFTFPDQADSTAKLAIAKIKAGENPPTVSIAEVERIISNKQQHQNIDHE